MTIVIRDSSMRPVSTSKNLRGLLDYTRRNRVNRVDIWPDKVPRTGALVGIEWTNGATTTFTFESLVVCQQWFAARKRFPAATVH